MEERASDKKYEVDIQGDGIEAINAYLKKIEPSKGINYRWFRGQANFGKHKKQRKLLPGIFRERFDNEFWMTTSFRNRAPMFGETSPRDNMDKWLFLMKHVDLPTRLLDWTESPLFALYFAVKSAKEVGSEPVVWALNPKALNYHSIYNYEGDDLSNENLDKEPSYFPNTWKDTGSGIGNIRLAFREINEPKIEPRCKFCKYKDKGLRSWLYEEYSNRRSTPTKNDKRIQLDESETVGVHDLNELVKDQGKEREHLCPKCRATKKPIAIQLTYCHPRMSAQKGCMTVHGTDKRALEDLVDPVFKKHKHLVKYIFGGNVDKIRDALHSAGITESVVYPDLLGLAAELKERFKKTSTDKAVNDDAD